MDIDRAVSAPQVLTEGGRLAPATIVLRRDRVAAVLDAPPAGLDAHIALPDGILAPGFVDLQVNGWAGIDFASAPAGDWVAAARGLVATGVTSFLPTLISAPLAETTAALRRALDAASSAAATPGAARIVGVHLEGPFLSGRHHGAHDPRWLADPTPALVDEILDAADGLGLLVTLAPERQGAIEAIRRLVAAGAAVSVGHSDATAAQVEAAFDAGARMVTHLFNAQRPMHHREPGVVGAALADERAVCGLIVDGHHVDPAVCGIAFRAAPGRIALVTDASAAGAMPPGDYLLGGSPILVDEGGAARRPDGRLAGSVLAMDRAVANAVELGVDLAEALRAATALPADVLSRPDLGRLAPGARADLVWLSPSLQAQAAWIGGQLVHGHGLIHDPVVLT